MLRAVSALCVETQALELCSATRRDVFKVFREYLPAGMGSSHCAAEPPRCCGAQSVVTLSQIRWPVYPSTGAAKRRLLVAGTALSSAPAAAATAATGTGQVLGMVSANSEAEDNMFHTFQIQPLTLLPNHRTYILSSLTFDIFIIMD